MEQEQNTSLFQLGLDGPSTYTLKNAASWARVLAVTGFIMAILFIIFGILMQTIISKAGGSFRSMEGLDGTSSMNVANSMGTMGLIIYVIFGGLYAISSLFAYSFASKVSTAIKTNDQDLLTAGFSGVRNFFAFWAVLSIIMLLFLLIGLAGVAVAPRY